MRLNKIFHQPHDVRAAALTDKLILPECYIGVELELERTFRVANSDLPLWNVTHDGSLRDEGREYIMGYQGAGDFTPIRGLDVIVALDILQQRFDDADLKPQISSRCSTHIHMDVRDLEAHQFVRLLQLWYKFDDAIVQHFSPTRTENHYCRRASSMPEVILRVRSLTDEPYNLRSFVENGDKYMALNWRNVDGRGSLEFRFFRGTIDMKEVLLWINLVQAFKYTAYDNLSDDYRLNEIISSHSQLDGLYIPEFTNPDIEAEYDDLSHRITFEEKLLDKFEANL